EPGKTHVEITARKHRPRQLEAARLASLRKLRKCRTTRVSQSEQLRRLVEGFAGSIVNRFAEQPVVAHRVDAHQLRVPAGYQERDEGKRRARLGQQRRQQMAFEVMDGKR